MNINLTLLGQSITMIVFVAFCVKFIWPPLMRALEERKKTIADGLAAAEKGQHELKLAEKHALDVIKKAKVDAAEVIAAAEKRAADLAEEAKDNARAEAERVIAGARAEIDQAVNQAREQLRKVVADLAVAGASKVLEKEVDATTHAKLLDAVARQL